MDSSVNSQRALSIFLSLLLLTGTIGAHAQTMHRVDLAQNMDGTLSETVEAGTYGVVIVNKLPGAHYDIKCIRSVQEIAEFPLSEIGPFTINKTTEEISCILLRTQISALDKLTSETVLADTLEKIRDDLNDPDSKCNSAATRKAMLKQLEERTEFVLNETFQLREGEVLTIVVSRNEGEKSHTWTHVLTTQPHGQWYVTYGFSFITDMFNAEETYFAKSVPDTTLYTITKKNSNASLTFVPCVLVHWVPTKWANKSFVPSLTGGLGFDLESPSVFFGGSVLFNSNLGIHLGVAAHKQNQLNGIYSAGEIIKENLTEEQLNEKFYTVNPFVSLSFRFSGSPFSGGKTTTEAESQ